MNYIISGRYILLLIVPLLISCDIFENNSGTPINENIWVNGYLVSWQHNPETEFINSGIMRTGDIDWDAITHLTYFTLHIGGDGNPLLSLDPALRHNFNSDRLRAIVPAAHNNNTKILFSVGGSTNYEEFSAAIDSSRSRFVETISNIIIEYGFDGVSLNMTPVTQRDIANYKEFVLLLSNTFDTLRTQKNIRPLLTIGTSNSVGTSSLYKDLQLHFDQINILTYYMARPWRGWISWHHSAMFNKNLLLENTPEYLPSVDGKVNAWISSGIERSKIGFAISFYGAIWDDVGLLEKWSIWPTEDQSIYHTLPYSQLSKNYNLEDYEWDKKAQAAYLEFEDPPSFVTFDNEETIFIKMKYAKKKRIGGVMIWDLSAGFSESESPENPLLKAIKPHINK